ncbi:YggL family protein [Sulfurovum sp. CS9]|uniref:YggL 50S ribosome-binding family protein n=1 Tax=Sulfurovum sp. CS9 TaxID=3391146 RepID=UPI0039E8A20F
MKKRLRKKKRVGEFQEMGFDVSFDIQKGLTVSEQNAILDDFITQAVEKNGLQFGGGGDIHWQGFIVLNKSRGSVSIHHRKIVQKWLEKNPKISNPHIGELRDVWYGWDSE